MFQLKNQSYDSQANYDRLTSYLTEPLNFQHSNYTLHSSDGSTDISVIDSSEFIQERLFADEIKHEFLELDIDHLTAADEWLDDQPFDDTQFDFFSEGQISIDEL